MRLALRKGMVLALFLVTFLQVDPAAVVTNHSLLPEADARIGHPATPGSVAGVARRTTRRTVRRSAIYISALPAGCARVTVYGTLVWRCGGTYYQSSGSRYVVVYVD
ncbi:hypothetical protein [Allomesorhizobium alhagi]|jgi:hypothetical protein|uniref:Uncharacterized protein n=1 Tax=Mesorhizobium alhagi CCNWXJ12-2 TaxID=1107882 RepID=H0HY84_9HYPH|nr:hypothetical protein [Mesorhizobium alhagi]EHK54366.1 hypothetical protein MAXJ12_25813 [Mesorhizobium alhagi CCNWXJ12-2]